jgi:hypothetical protein
VLVEHREWAGGGVEWWHPNPLTGSWVQSGGLGDGRREVDPLGSEVGTEDPFPPTLQVQYTDVYGGDLLFLEAGDPFDPRGGCSGRYGMPASCSRSASPFDAFDVGAGAGVGGGGMLAYGLNPWGPMVDLAPDFEDWLWRKGYYNGERNLYDLDAEYQREISGAGSAPQNTSSNPNCFMYAVRGNPNPGIARNWTAGHNGYHSLGPGKVFALAPMVGGEVKKVTLGDKSPDAYNTIVDVAIPGGKYVAILADMGKVSVLEKSFIRAGQQIGIVTGGPGTKGGYGVIDGLHFALIRAEFYGEYRRLTPFAADLDNPKSAAAAAEIEANQSKWFVDPLKEGPFQCPGITSRIDMPIRNGVPTTYPIP